MAERTANEMTVKTLTSALLSYNPNAPVRVRIRRKLVDINDIMSVIDIDNKERPSVCLWIKEE